MAGIEQRGGEPQQERRDISRREFFEYFKGALVGGIVVFSVKDSADTEQQLNQVRKEAEEELKTQRVHDYKNRVHKLVFQKAPFLVAQNTLDRVGKIGGGIMIGNKLYKAIRNEKISKPFSSS
jgi:hypothetical protein